MSGYKTRLLDVTVGQLNLRLKALKDRNQYFDPQDQAKDAGITAAYWSFFGQLWPASMALARSVKQINFKNKRILELGCGLALPSLVLQAQGSDVMASDRHPLSHQFLDFNSELNQLNPVPFTNLCWENPDLSIGQFDAIIASDVLYEEQHINQLAEIVKLFANPEAQVLIACPGRGFRNKFSKKLIKQGFDYTAESIAFEQGEKAPFRGRLLKFKRTF